MGNHKFSINVNQLAYGSYFVQIKVKDGSEVVRRLVKISEDK